MPALIPIVVQRSPFNCLQFVREESPREIIYNTIHPGTAWEHNTYPFGVARVNYPYKAEVTDPFEFQFNITVAGLEDLQLHLIRPLRTPDGTTFEILHTWTYAAYLLTNNVYDLDGTEAPQGTYHFKGSYLDYDEIAPGTYYFRLELGYSSDNTGTQDRTEYWLSEKVDLKYKQPGTILITARHSSNNLDADTVFVQTDAEFAMRTEGALHSFNPDSVDNSYTSQKGAIRQLYSRPGSSKILTIGGLQGVPRWVKECANYLVSADFKAVDGVEIAKDKDAQWELIEANPAYPLGGMSLSVRYAKPDQVYTDIVRPYIELFSYDTFPYFITTARLREGADPAVILGGPFYVTNRRDQQDMINALNRAARKEGLKGTVSASGKQVRYNNGIGESYDTSETVILPYFLEFTGDLSISTLPTSISLIASRTGIVWSKNDIEVAGLGTIAFYNPSKSYSGSGPYATRIFHNNNVEQVTTVTANITGFSGTIPSILEGLGISGTQLSGEFDMSMLLPARLTLDGIHLANNQITSLVNTGVLSDPVTLFEVLNSVELNENKLGIASVDNLIVDVDAMVQITLESSGVLNLEQQDPPAPPTTGGISSAVSDAIDDLTNNFFWTVTTD